MAEVIKEAMYPVMGHSNNNDVGGGGGQLKELDHPANQLETIDNGQEEEKQRRSGRRQPSGDKFGSDTIVGQLNNLQLIGGDNADEEDDVVVPRSDCQPVITSLLVMDGQKKKATDEDFIKHNNSVCVEEGMDSQLHSELLAIASNVEVLDEEDDETEEDELSREEASVGPVIQKPRESRKSEGDVIGGSKVSEKDVELLAKQRVHNSKSMCDNDLRVDHLINKKDSMRIRFDDNGDAQIQKRDILHRKFYKSVDDELHKKAVQSMSGKSQCMTLDRVFKKLKGQIRKLGEDFDGLHKICISKLS